MQTPFTDEVLARSGVSDSLIPRTLQALKTLELIDGNGMPTETLENLRRVPEPEFKNAVASWIRSVYADVLAFADPADDETTIRDAFRNYNPVGQQARMVSLFMGLCRFAGLRTDGEAQPAKRRTPRKPAASGNASTTPMRRTKPTPHVKQQHAHDGLPPPIAGLLTSLPADGEWTQAERDRFVTTFKAVLDFCYQVREPQEEAES